MAQLLFYGSYALVVSTGGTTLTRCSVRASDGLFENCGPAPGGQTIVEPYSAIDDGG